MRLIAIKIDLQRRKLHFIESILSVGSEEIIEKLEALLEKEQRKENNQRVSIDQYNQEIEEANSRIESGEFTSQDDVKKESESWLK